MSVLHIFGVDNHNDVFLYSNVELLLLPIPLLQRVFEFVMVDFVYELASMLLFLCSWVG